MNRHRIFGTILIAVAVWTAATTIALPALRASAAGLPPTLAIEWDLWWAVQIALGWKLLREGPSTWFWATVVTWLEIAVTGVKVFLFFPPVAWDAVAANWVANRCAILALFAVLAFHLHLTEWGRALKEKDRTPEARP